MVFRKKVGNKGERVKRTVPMGRNCTFLLLVRGGGGGGGGGGGERATGVVPQERKGER